MSTFASRIAFALALSAVTFASAAFAQDSSPTNSSPTNPGNAATAQHHAPDPQKQAARLAQRLGLNADQSAKITTILQNQQQQMAAAGNGSSTSKQDLHTKMRAIHQDADTQINAVLTPDQQTQYANLKAQMKQRMQNAHQAGSAPDSGNNGGN